MMLKKRAGLLLAFLFVSLLVYGQGRPSQTLYRAEKLFEIGNYDDALSSYLKVLEEGESVPYVQYMAGRCYLLSASFAEKLKAIPLLKAAVAGADESMPAELYLYMGDALYLEGNMFQALSSYDRYKAAVGKEAAKVKAVEARIAKTHKTQEIMGKPKDIQLRSLSKGVNSAYTEYNPVVAADESLMAYTVLKPADSRSSQEFVEQIMVLKRQGQEWGTPQPLNIGSGFMAGTAGLSADGQQMIIYLNSGSKGGELYMMWRKGDSWGSPQELVGDINSRYQESTASIVPDGRTIYFASNRPGGFGGMDIYKTELQSNGAWGRAENLGATVNTAADEDAPFIHPDGRTLFFTSNGHQSMGGNDVFRTHFLAGKWSIPENMGYPINTVANDNYFTLTADGSRAYFSSDRPGGQGAQDIYTFDMPKEDRNIPLTMVKGRVLAGENERPVNTVIKVVDNETGKKIDYVYNPDPETGNYLIIFPPGHNYDMIIQAEGYLPYAININIPDQDYFYELYQQVFLRPVKQFDVVVGQEVEVKNAFYNAAEPMHSDLRKAKESMLVQEDSIDLYEMMETIIGAEDKAAYDYLLDLMYATNPIDEVDFSAANGENVESAEVVYYYEENDKTKLEAKKVGNEVIYTLPTFYVAEEAKKQAKKKEQVASVDQSLLKPVYKIYFGPDAKSLKAEDEKLLEEILAKFKDHSGLGVEISGYASEDGDAEYNRQLSNDRAITVLNYFNERGIGRRRVVAKGYGATEGSEGNVQESRRVEVRIIDLSRASR
ncbi:OmpA family protein [Nafulsella turpanensis]|uniref:OmpA family protein n=1 Tax=Nafulsella turpanensis TaxID=1265690 RepID=UPI0003489FA8|nr:OmpA family protein [Nafulsella turpanensis]